jgi:cellulose synthase/poly-beta-1,6-N-acetylglucosamine synthase-like glycosyltransferase
MIPIIIVTLDEEENIKFCLDSLMALNYPKNNLSIIVVDGGSKDRTVEIIKKYPVKLLVRPGANVAKCKNEVFNINKSEYVIFIDADVRVDPNWLNELVKAAKGLKENVAAIGGPNLIMEEDFEMAKLIGYAQSTFLGSGGSPQTYNIKKIKEVISISNCNSLYKWSILKENRFDENFNIGDDLELNFRLKLKGYKFLYVPNAIVYHRRPKNLRELVHKSKIYSIAMAKVTKKYLKIPRWYAAIPSLGLIALALFPILYLINHKAIYLYTLIFVIYILGLAISTLVVYEKTRSLDSLNTLIILPLQHLAYGAGYIKGLFL